MGSCRLRRNYPCGRCLYDRSRPRDVPNRSADRLSRGNITRMRFLAAALLLGWSALAEAEKFEIVPISHATVAVESGAETIVVDPWCKGDFTGVPLADLVLITDIHGDHMDPPCVDKVRKPDAVIFAPAAVAEKVKGVTVIGNGETKHWHDWTI